VRSGIGGGKRLPDRREVRRARRPVRAAANINVPCLPEEKIRGMRITKQGLRVYRDELVTRIDPRGKPYYWIGGGPPEGILEEETDYWAVSQGFVSVTPVQLDLTAYDALKFMREWTWGEGEDHA
jgi:5'-nucleotidase